MAIVDFEEGNPEGIGENNEALFWVEHFGEREGFKEQKGIFT